MARTGLSRALTVAIALVAAPSARAAEYCVTCSGPDASYRCEVGGSAVDARAWLQCITELAKEGGHDSCSVDRNAPSPCPGMHKVLAPPEGNAPPAPPVQVAVPEPAPAVPPPEAAALPPGEPGETAAEPTPKRVPQTVKEMAGDALESSKEGLKQAGDTVTNSAQKAGEAVSDTAKAAGDGIGKAGSAVGNAAKKTWTCVTSLFQTC